MQEITLATRLNKAFVPVTQTQQLVYVLISARPGQAIAQTRIGLNLGLVLDQSGSMRGEKLERLKQALHLALGKLAPEDVVSLTVFNDRAQVLAPAAPVRQQSGLLGQVDRLRAGGGTEMARGLSLGLREVYRQFAAERGNQVLLLTDGQTYGDEAQCLKLAKESGEHHIAIQALGLGDDWNENLLDEIGKLSGGGSDLIAQPDQITPLFAQTVERSSKAVVRNAQVTLRLAAGVEPRQVWQVTPLIANLGYTPIGQRDVQVELGELDAQEGKALLVELLLPPRQAGRYRVAQAEIRYDLPLASQVGLVGREDIVLSYSADAEAVRAYDPLVMNLVEKMTAYKLQTRALDEARMGNIAGATQKLRAAATRLLELGEGELAQAAQREADNLEQSGQMSAGGAKQLRYQTRKLTQRLPDLPE